MRVSVILLTIFGLVAAVCAAVLVQMISRRPATQVTKLDSDPEVKLMVASRALPAMTVLDAGAVETRTLRKSELPPGGMTNSVQVVGKVLTRPVVAGEAFSPSCFANDGMGLYLAAALPPGKRAVSISLRDHTSMAGILYPGSVVDVLVSLQGAGKDGGNAMATTLLQGIQVMGVGSQTIVSEQEFKDKNPGALAKQGQINTRMVTLLVTPKQAEILQLATQYGTVALTLRNPLDDKPTPQDLTRLADFTGSRTGLAGQVASLATAFLQNRAEQAKLAGDSPMAPVPAGHGGASDPFASSPSSTPTTQPAETNPLWEMLVVRGANAEKRSFPMSEVDNEFMLDVNPRPAPDAQPAGGAVPAGAG